MQRSARRHLKCKNLAEETGQQNRTGKKEISGAVEQGLGTTQQPLRRPHGTGRPAAFPGSGRSRNVLWQEPGSVVGWHLSARIGFPLRSSSSGRLGHPYPAEQSTV